MFHLGYIQYLVLVSLLFIYFGTDSLMINRVWAKNKRLSLLRLGSEIITSITEYSSRNNDKEDIEMERIKIKSKLYSISASCDRGFASSREDRKMVNLLVEKLQEMNPTANAAQNLYPNNNLNSSVTVEVPIEGVWKLVYTSAFDVLSLSANPFFIIQGIYQVIKQDGSSVNVIDIAPRIQSLLPSAVSLDSSVRLKVYTTTSAREVNNRVGLTFRKVEVKPMSLLGMSLSLPSLIANLPQATLFGSNIDSKGILGKEGPGYFDVLYLDDDCLVIKQNSPGGIFISIKSDESIDNF